jgi:hypothetical protein
MLDPYEKIILKLYEFSNYIAINLKVSKLAEIGFSKLMFSF